MNLLLLTNKAVYPVDDGHSFAMSQMISGLCMAGVGVDVLSMNTNKHPKPCSADASELPKGCSYETIPVFSKPNGLTALINIFSKQSYFVSRFKSQNFYQAILSKLKHKRYDVIQFEGVFVSLYLQKLKPFTVAPCVLRTHNIEYKLWNDRIAFMPWGLKRWYLKLQTKRLQKFEIQQWLQSDAIIPISPEDQEFINVALNSPKPVKYIPVGLNIQTSEMHAKRDLLFVGSMDWKPNYLGLKWFFKHVWPSLLENRPDLTLTLVGRGAHTLFNNIPQVYCLDFIPKLAKVYAEHRLVIIPVFFGGGVRIKFLEALANGKAIITTRLGATGISNNASGAFLLADTPSEFCQQIIKVLEDGMLKSQLEKNAQRLIEQNYNNSQWGKELALYYLKLKV